MPTIKTHLVNKEFAFDIKLRAAVRVHGPNKEEAIRRLREALDCATANLGWDELGDRPLVAEVTLDGGPVEFDSEE